jgi:hypothetical protein
MPLETRTRAAEALFRESFDAAEEIIINSLLPPEKKAAVWLYVWSLQSRAEQLRFADDCIRELELVGA